MSLSAFNYAGGAYPGAGGTCGKTLGHAETCSVVLVIFPSHPNIYQGNWVLRYWDGEKPQTLAAPLKATVDNGSFQLARGFDGYVEAILRTDFGVYVAGSFTAHTRHLGGRILRFKNDTDGVEDTTFASSPGFNGAVICLAADGEKIYAGGSFTQYAGSSRRYLARLNRDGSLDTGFTAALPGDLPDAVRAVFLDTRNPGKVYVGGGDGTAFLYRLNSDGSRDMAFTTPSFSGYRVNQIVAAPDAPGELYVAGSFTMVNGTPRKALMRITESGTVLGYSAGVDGDLGNPATYIETLLPLEDGTGDILIGGNFATVGATTRRGIARIGPDGTLRTAYSGLGFNAAVSNIALLPNGSTYVLGEFTSYDSNGARGIVRLDANGSVEPEFSAGPTSFDLLDVDFGALLVRQDGSVCAAGSFNKYQTLPARKMICLDPTGIRDDRFLTTVGMQGVNATAALPEGKGLYVGGNFVSALGSPAQHLIRVKSNGERDGSFSDPALNGAVNAIQQAGDGSGQLYVGGTFTLPQSRVARLNSDGSVDSSYYPTISATVTTMALVKNPSSGLEQAYIGGGITLVDGSPVTYIARLNSSGTLDSGFLPSLSSAPTILAPAPDSSGAIYVGGSFTTVNGTDSSGLARLNWDGSLDPGFGVGTGFTPSFQIRAILPLASGKVYVGGIFSTYQSNAVTNLIRLNRDGTLDTSANLPTFSSTVESLAMDEAGRIYAGGNFATPAARIVRLLPDGSLDGSFSPGGVSFNSTVKSIALARDGSNEVYVSGPFTTFAGMMTDNLARLSNSGPLD